MALPIKKPTPDPKNGGARRLGDSRTFILPKGELLFDEGETSKSMYLVKRGILRIFKKRGKSNVEIGTIHSGEVIGELAFLDGQPRSAAAEALAECELVEISGKTFTETLEKSPEWLKTMLKTVVGRLRAASTKIRQLETTSTAIDYKADGAKSKYVFASISDAMKVATGVLLAASRFGEKGPLGTIIKISTLELYVHHVNGVPMAKISAILDIFSQIGIVNIDEANLEVVTLVDGDYLEGSIRYMNDQNLAPVSKQKNLTKKGFVIMSMIYTSLDQYIDAKDPTVSQVNVGKIREAIAQKTGKKPFENRELEELIKLDYLSQMTVLSDNDIMATVNAVYFKKEFKMQRVIKAIEFMNEKKDPVKKVAA